MTVSANDSGSGSGGSGSGGGALPWIYKWPPRCGSDLALHPKKVEEVRTWLQHACADIARAGSTNAAAAQQRVPVKRLLVLYGPPGIGKSAMVEALAHDLGLPVLSWSDAGPRGGGSSFRRDSSFQRPYQPGALHVPYVPTVESFRRFLEQATLFRALPMRSVANTATASAAPTPRASGNMQLVLLEDIPMGRTDGDKDVVRRALSTFLRTSRYPAVYVASGGESPGDSVHVGSLRKHLSDVVLMSPHVTTIK